MAREMPNNLVTEPVDDASLILQMAFITLADNEAAIEGVKEAKFYFKAAPLALESAFDQEFSADTGPVFEIDRVLHKAGLLGIFQKALPVQNLKKAGKVNSFCKDVS